jgi:hypothetical protein
VSAFYALREMAELLATTDGGPRVHPMMPVLVDGRLHVFVVRLSPRTERHDDSHHVKDAETPQGMFRLTV